MPKIVRNLTERDIATLGDGMHADGRGLYLAVGQNSRSWVYRFSDVTGKRREMGLGSVADVSSEKARKRLGELREAVANGIDPIDQKRQLKADRRLARVKHATFAECAEHYIAAKKGAWKSGKHAQQWESTLSTYTFPVFGNEPVALVDTAMIVKALEPIWISKAETAGRLRGRIEKILDWAKTRELRQGENPARWRGHLEHSFPSHGKVQKVEHHAAVPYAVVPAVVARLHGIDSIPARALEFAIVNCSRTGEVLGAKWTEINLEARVWTIPAERMKAGQEHRIPLTTPALAILEAMQPIANNPHGLIFPGASAKGTLSDMAMRGLLKRIGHADATVHGFRSSFRDWAAETRPQIPGVVAEAALAHTLDSKVEAAYLRTDRLAQRRELAEAWATYCAD